MIYLTNLRSHYRSSNFRYRGVAIGILIITLAMSSIPVVRSSTYRQEPLPKCTLDDFKINGQQWIAGGTVGGIETDINLVNQNGGVMPANLLADPQVGDGMASSIISNPNIRVLLLIIDDFQSSSQVNSHGKLVLDVALDSLFSVSHTSHVVVGKVDIAPENTAVAVAVRTEQAITNYGGFDSFDFVVLNMSFIFLPCEGPIQVSNEVALDYNVAAFLEEWRGAEGVPQSLLDLLTNQLINESSGLDAGFIVGINSEGEPLVYEPESPDADGTVLVNNTLALLEGVTETTVTADLVDGTLDQIHANGFGYTERPYELVQLLQAIQVAAVAPLVEGDPAIARLVAIMAFERYVASVADDENPMKIYLTDMTAGMSLIPIASAGNGFRTEPAPPGKWPSVISVSGSTANALNSPWAQTHFGEIMSPAAWYEIHPSMYVAGTSFAAPIASVVASLLASTSSNCNFSPLMDKAFDNEYFIGALSNACQP